MKDQALSRVKENYGSAICTAFDYLLDKYPEVFVIGQGLWSPWYVGNSMTDLDTKYGAERVIDTPLSESGITASAVGASLAGMRPIVVHPRMDFMIYAMDAIVNQAAKWSHMTGGQDSPAVTIRAIINRGGEQGAQHSQALHAWFAHVPGLKVVVPSTVKDARDLLVASVLSNHPVLYIDDRWLYDQEDELGPIEEIDLSTQGPKVIKEGTDLTIVSSGYGTYLASKVSNDFDANISTEIIDLRVLNPYVSDKVIESVTKTKNLLVIDPGTKTAGFASEVITSVVEEVGTNIMDSKPRRLTLPDTPAPVPKHLEDKYYFHEDDLIEILKTY